ncbi:MAG: sporulation protein YabP [Syntrophomonadaceae bacterium]|nr:sporulation protein YabP [Syntrophomonadaceae bacterium]
MADHTVKLSNRRNMELSGVNNVINFDEEKIILQTAEGYLYIIGQELHITALNLDEGKVALEGNVDSMEYKALGADIKVRGKNILNRLLK